MAGEKEKAARDGTAFVFYLISSEYQVGRISLPKIFGIAAAEVVLYQCLLLSCGRRGVDNSNDVGSVTGIVRLFAWGLGPRAPLCGVHRDP